MVNKTQCLSKSNDAKFSSFKLVCKQLELKLEQPYKPN